MTEKYDIAAAPFKPRYGSFNLRTLAAMIDLGILMIPGQPFSDYLTDRLFGPLTAMDMGGVFNSETTQDAPHAIHGLWQFITQQHILERMVFENLLLLALIAAYTLPFWFAYSSTPGKMLFGYTIRDAKTYEKMTRRQALERFGGYIVALLPLTLGFVWIIFNRKRQGLHDLIANTVVIKKPKVKKAEPPEDAT